jgi:23S rRNA pseudouridine2605 synthase
VLIRLNKFLAEAGIGSRRKCEKLIIEGRVIVNDEIVLEVGRKIDPQKDKIFCEGRLIKPQQKVYFILHKPKGYLCTTFDPQGRKTIMDLIGRIKYRVFPVGRLDKDSSGLVLLTNDGEFANRMMHPRFGMKRTYFVVVRGSVLPQHLEKITKGVWLSEGKTSPAKIRVLKKFRNQTHLEITLVEGKKREVRRIFAKFGYKVKRLVRTSFGPFHLGRISEGQFCHIPLSKISALIKD